MKTRVLLREYNNGEAYYIPQYKSFLSWKPVKHFYSTVNAPFDKQGYLFKTEESARNCITEFLAQLADKNIRKVYRCENLDERIVSITYKRRFIGDTPRTEYYPQIKKHFWWVPLDSKYGYSCPFDMCYDHAKERLDLRRKHQYKETPIV